MLPDTPAIGKLRKSNPVTGAPRFKVELFIQWIPVQTHQRINVVGQFVVPLVRPVPKLRSPVIVGRQAKAGAAQPVAPIENLRAAGHENVEIAVAEIRRRGPETASN